MRIIEFVLILFAIFSCKKNTHTQDDSAFVIEYDKIEDSGIDSSLVNDVEYNH